MLPAWYWFYSFSSSAHARKAEQMAGRELRHSRPRVFRWTLRRRDAREDAIRCARGERERAARAPFGVHGDVVCAYDFEVAVFGYAHYARGEWERAGWGDEREGGEVVAETSAFTSCQFHCCNL